MRPVLILLSVIICSAMDPGQMASIPAGDFQMGRTKLTRDDSTKMRPNILLDDRPVHKVTLHSFQMDRYEVSNQGYSAFVKATRHSPPYHWKNGAFPISAGPLPVYNVSWMDAHAYCEWAGKRLPTEAEWERAARGGKAALDYPDNDKIDATQARFNSPLGPVAVGSFPPNAFGLFDMVGNVAEWTADWFDGTYYAAGDRVNPTGPASGEYKVIRGGAWSDPPSRITVFFRNWVRPAQSTPNIGFRCVQ